METKTFFIFLSLICALFLKGSDLSSSVPGSDLSSSGSDLSSSVPGSDLSSSVPVPGLSSGAIVGIVVVILVAVAVAAAGVIYHRHRISELERQIQRRLAVTEGEPVFLIPDGETLVVTEGGSVTLKPYDTEIHEDDDIQLKFEGTLIAERKGENREITVHDDVHDGIFKDRLELDQDSRSLIITDIRFTMSGRYELRIIKRGHESLTTFYVFVFDPSDVGSNSEETSEACRSNSEETSEACRSNSEEVPLMDENVSDS